MVVLYDRLGNSFCFSSSAWQEVLTSARRCGWEPKGTASPPPRWALDTTDSESIPWDGNYSRPEGQLVLPDDAESLGRAVKSVALEREDKTLGEFAMFCGQRGFLISSKEFVVQPRTEGTLFAFPSPRRMKTPVGRAS